jgi:hypothetical protein
MKLLHSIPKALLICFIFTLLLPGCGNPSKEELFSVAPFMLLATAAVAFIAERMNSRFTTYLVSFIVAVLVFITNLFLQLIHDNRFFYFTVIIQTFIVYTATVHLLLNAMVKISDKKMKSLVIPSLSVFIILISFMVIVSLNANPGSGEVGNLTIKIFGWPLQLFASFSRMMNNQ